MAYRIQGLGWLPDPFDHRDRRADTEGKARIDSVAHAFGAAARRRPTAESRAGRPIVDLRPDCSPIENQGEIGSCTAHATIGALEYFERKAHGVHVEASRLFLYKVTRRYLGWTGDRGAFVRTAIKSLKLFGAVPEVHWPYDTREFDREPEAFHYALAQSYRAVEYYRLDGSRAQVAGTLDRGLPVIFGFTCYSSLDAPETGRTGVIPYPTSREQIVGGHAVLAVGYTDTHVLLRNSWGNCWGDGGYGYLPWTYFDPARPLADDCWVLVNADFVPEDLDDSQGTSASEGVWIPMTGPARRKSGREAGVRVKTSLAESADEGIWIPMSALGEPVRLGSKREARGDGIWIPMNLVPSGAPKTGKGLTAADGIWIPMAVIEESGRFVAAKGDR